MPRLSNRELDTLAVLCRTPHSPPPPPKIAAELGLAPAIIHRVLGALGRKLGVAPGGSAAATHAALAARAIDLGLARAGDGPPPGGRAPVYPVPPPPAGPAPADAWTGSGQAARMPGVGLTTVIRWADQGRIQTQRDPGSNHRRYSMTSLRALMAAQSRGETRPVPGPGPRPRPSASTAMTAAREQSRPSLTARRGALCRDQPDGGGDGEVMAGAGGAWRAGGCLRRDGPSGAAGSLHEVAGEAGDLGGQVAHRPAELAEHGGVAGREVRPDLGCLQDSEELPDARRDPGAVPDAGEVGVAGIPLPAGTARLAAFLLPAPQGDPAGEPARRAMHRQAPDPQRPGSSTSEEAR